MHLDFNLDEESSRVRSVLDFVPNYEGSSPPEIFLNGEPPLGVRLILEEL